MANLKHQPHGAVQGDPLVAGQGEDLGRESPGVFSGNCTVILLVCHTETSQKWRRKPGLPAAMPTADQLLLSQRFSAVLAAVPPMSPPAWGQCERLPDVCALGLHCNIQSAFSNHDPFLPSPGILERLPPPS